MFRYQHLFRAMSHRGCSLNDNRFLLACNRNGIGRLALNLDFLTVMQAFMSRYLEVSMRLRDRGKAWKRWIGSSDVGWCVHVCQ